MNQNSSYSSPQGGITPAMLATFQHQKSNIFGAQSNAGGNINPAQLLNGSAAINPTQLLQQQHNMINGMGIPSGGGGSINPAALTAASPPSSSHNSPFSQQQQQQHVPNFNSMLQVVGITREQFQSLSPQDKQTVGAKYMSAFNAHQQQQQMAMMNAGLMNNNNSNNAFSNQSQNQNFYDRPSSSASSHSQPQQPSSSNQMLPPPPPRPPTAQDGQSQSGPHPSRPGTSLAHRSPTIPGGHQGQMLEMMHMKEMMQHQGQQRSQSRMAHRGDPMMNGFNSPMGVKPPNQQQQGLFTGHQHQLSQHSQQSQSQSSGSNANAVHQQNQYSNQPPQITSSPPAMDSPYRGTPTRKIGADMGSTPGPGGTKMPMGMGVPGSPRIGGGLGLGGGQGNVAGAGIMGPPGLPRSVSGDAMNMMGNNNANANVGNMINGQQRQSPRPPSSIGMNADMSSRLGPSGPQQQQQQQRQGSIPPQFSIPLQQQQMRQGSLPPGTGPGQQQRQKMGQDGMNIGGGSMGGGMGMGMKTNNEMRASMTPTSTTPMNMPMNMGMSGMNPMGGMNPGMNNMGGMNPMNMIPPAPHSSSSASSASHTPASPLVGGGGPGPQGLVPSLSVSAMGSDTRIKASIDVGKKRYWVGLLPGINFTGLETQAMS